MTMSFDVVLLMLQKSGDHQLRLVVFPIGFYTSQVVVWDFFHQPYSCWWVSHQPSLICSCLLFWDHLPPGQNLSSTFTVFPKKKTGEISARDFFSKVTLIVVELVQKKQLEKNHRLDL